MTLKLFTNLSPTKKVFIVSFGLGTYFKGVENISGNKTNDLIGFI